MGDMVMFFEFPYGLGPNFPATGEDKNQWGEDWNDESVYSEQPFGQKIGDSTPFDNVVKSTVDSIVESLKKKI